MAQPQVIAAGCAEEEFNAMIQDQLTISGERALGQWGLPSPTPPFNVSMLPAHNLRDPSQHRTGRALLPRAIRFCSWLVKSL